MATIRLEGSEVRQALRRLGGASPKIVADSLRKTAFEIRDAEQREIAGAFDFAGSNTERFLSRSVRFTAVRPGVRETTIYPLPKSAEILVDHEEGATIRPDRRRLAQGGQLAAPVAGQRGASGKVRATEGPARLLAQYGERRARGRRQRKAGRFVFVSRSGRALVEAVSGRIRVLYALTTSARLARRLQFVRTAERTANRELPRKVAEVFEKEARAAARR